jgi:ATP-independent RNA helicase DbpA
LSEKLFSTLALPPSQLSNLADLGYLEMTPVQAATLPAILQGKDVRARAQTGSGKTAAFGIGIIDKIQIDNYRTQALVLCPTRELADQVSKALRQLARYIGNIKILTLCGGQPIGVQRDSLAHAPHIVVGTPGRILDHLRKENLSLEHAQMLVLDEADRMLDMGFSDDIEAIFAYAAQVHQTLLFSATYPREIEKLSAKFLSQPVIVELSDDEQPPEIHQYFIETTAKDRFSLLAGVLCQQQPVSCVIFCNTRRDCQLIADFLTQHEISALSLQGELEQRERDQVLVRFANGSCRVLVATDVAARGLDIARLDLVINYQLAFDPEVHIHRIGRTGRAGAQGVAISLVSQDEMVRVNAIEDNYHLQVEWQSAASVLNEPLVPLVAQMRTLCIDGGRKAKIRPGDILGALTGDAGLSKEQIGKIDLFPVHAYVAIEKNSAKKALQWLKDGKIKGKRCKAFLLR